MYGFERNWEASLKRREADIRAYNEAHPKPEVKYVSYEDRLIAIDRKYDKK